MKTVTINERQINLDEVQTVNYQGPSVTIVYSKDGSGSERKVQSPAKLRLNLHSGELIIVPDEEAEPVWEEIGCVSAFV